MTQAEQWKRESRARRAEERLSPPALEQDRGLRVRSELLPTSAPRPSRLLRVETDYFVAGAVWEKIGGAWSCVHAAPILRWMKGKNSDEAKLALLRMGAKYDFIPLPKVTGRSHGVTA
jgi:hypothetical protein